MQHQINTGLLTNLPNQRAKITQHQSPDFTILVAGESGCGKSTFIKCLLGDQFDMFSANPKEPRSNQPRQFSAAFPLESMDKSKAFNSSKLSVMTEIFANANITAIETGDFGDFEDNTHSWVPIVNYVNRQHAHYMYITEQPNRSMMIDPRVHLCVYFVPPTGRLHELDLMSIMEISKCCNLIVCISKADSMTRSDLLSLKHEIRNKLDEQQVELFNTGEEQPYSIVASNDLVELSDGRMVLGREYRWGSVDVTDLEHSDLSKLKEVILKTHTLPLVNRTNERFYNDYRHEMRITRVMEGMKISERMELETLSWEKVRSAISEYSEAQLMKSLGNKDVLLERQISEIRSQFDFVRDYQLSRFDQIEQSLREKQSTLENELREMQEENSRLEVEIDQLKSKCKRK